MSTKQSVAPFGLAASLVSEDAVRDAIRDLAETAYRDHLRVYRTDDDSDIETAASVHVVYGLAFLLLMRATEADE